MKEYFNRKRESRKGFIIVELTVTIALIGSLLLGCQTSPTITSEDCFTMDEPGIITGYKDTCSRDMVIPNMIDGVSVTSIGDYAFIEKDITSVVFPEGLVAIGSNSFRNNNLTSITIPQGVIDINNRAFEYNPLSIITIPDSVEYIGHWTFYSNGPDMNSENIKGAASYEGPTKYSDELIFTPAEGPWTGTWILDDDSTDWKLLP